MTADAQELNTALFDLQRYLLDQIPPLNATDAVEVLMVHPPELLMQQVNAFALEQGRIQGASMADCLFHALKKVHMISTLKLIDHSSLERYLNTVIPLALAACPPADRATLEANLRSLRDQLQFVTPVSAVHLGGQTMKRDAKESVLSDVAAKTARRFSLVIDRLMRKGGGTIPPQPAPVADIPVAAQVQPMAQLAAMAAETSSSEEELNRFVDSLKPLTGGKPQSDIISVLAANVPGWEIVTPEGATPSKSIAAMHKVMSLTRDSSKSGARFRELVMAAIGQFNDGSIGAAASILDLAATVAEEKKIDAITLDRIHNDALDAVSSEQLKKYTENKARHPILRRFLGFFPKLQKETLFADLRGEERPERRRAVLALLEAYGTEGRDAAIAELDKEYARPEPEQDTYYLRNLIYLLHRIPRDPGAPVDKELALLAKATAVGQSIYVVKEAALPLGQMKGDAPVKLLTQRLAEYEALLLRTKDKPVYPPDEVQKLLDRITAALAKIGTPAALLTVARHGMKANPILGDTRARLAALSQYDLSFDEQTVNVIVKAIRDDLPSGKLLGRIIPKRQAPPLKMIEALSSTRSETVEKLLADVAQNFADEDVGRTAAAALQNLSSAGTPAGAGRETATLTGDLQFFGLPALMQSLSDTQATGIVTLSGKHCGQTAGKLLFVNGQVGDAQAGQLRGVEAVYQMLERPIVGTFAFVSTPPENVKIKNEPVATMAVLLEGIRRFDEFKQACVIVPDDAVLKPTGQKPTAAEDESDPQLIREVWVNACKGTRVAEWEQQIAADPYRVRRLLAHWVDQGALQPAS